MKIFRYLILFLVILNIPSVALVTVNSSVSNLLSLTTFVGLIVYYVIASKSQPSYWMIYVGLLYFSISSLSDQSYLPLENKDYYYYIFKYFIYVICGYELLKKITLSELIVFLVLGALTIAFESFFLPELLSESGRPSGFYLNPNKAGFICILGYSLTFGVQNQKVRFIIQLLFTFLGLLTFSRTFIVIWVIMNIISLKIDIKNIRVFGYGIGLLFALLIISEFVNINNTRINEVEALLTGGNARSSDITSDSRTATWALYYDAISKRPFFGNGFDSFGGNTNINQVGVHNSYLKVLGEAGIFVFLVFLCMFITIINRTWANFNIFPYQFLFALSIIFYLTTTHNFFDMGYLIFTTLWILTEIDNKELKKDLPLT